MQFKFTFKHLEALDSIKDYAVNRFEKLDRLNLHKEMEIHFIFSVQKADQIAEVLINNGSNHYAATAKDPSLYASIDLAVDKIGIQLRKHKEKIQNHHDFPASNEGYLRKELADQARALRDSGDHEHGVAKGRIKRTS